jgi:hypothetical protein
MSVADKLTALQGIKQDIKEAINAKGVVVADNMTEYADAIRGLPPQGKRMITRKFEGSALSYDVDLYYVDFDRNGDAALQVRMDKYDMSWVDYNTRKYYYGTAAEVKALGAVFYWYFAGLTSPGVYRLVNLGEMSEQLNFTPDADILFAETSDEVSFIFLSSDPGLAAEALTASELIQIYCEKFAAASTRAAYSVRTLTGYTRTSAGLSVTPLYLYGATNKGVALTLQGDRLNGDTIAALYRNYRILAGSTSYAFSQTGNIIPTALIDAEDI